MIQTLFSERYASHPSDVKHYDTGRLRQEFLADSLFEANRARFIYSYFDRFIAGGIVPVDSPITLSPLEPMKAESFCERREAGMINLGGKALITVDGVPFEVGKKDAIYIARSSRAILCESRDKSDPAILYVNSTPAHQVHTTRLIRKTEARIMELGTAELSNHRKISQMIVEATCATCQLQMGITELQPGSVWNTMPPHTHNRRMEVYLYTDVPEGQAVCHFMGTPDETRHIWLKNNQAIISPPWSIHSAAGTASYSFIWGMAGENLDFGDMDGIQIQDLK